MSSFRSLVLAAVAAALFASACDAPTPAAPDPPRDAPTPATVSIGTLQRSPSEAVGLATVTSFIFTAQGFVSSDGSPLTYQWDFGDGEATVGGASVSHVYGGPGVFDVRVVATNSSGRTAEANASGVPVTTLTGRWTSRLAISSGIVSFDMTQVGAELRGVSDFYGPARSILAGRLTSPGHLDLTLTVQPGSGGVSTPFSFNFSLDTNSTASSLFGQLTGPSFCPCPTIIARQ